MSSVEVDDRSTKARIRDAAIEVFAVEGSGTTARKVAEAAGVSPGLVIHHFGSMGGLRKACDDHVIAVIRAQKTDAMGGGPGVDLVGAIRSFEDHHLPAYLARMLAEDSDSSAHLVDAIVADAEEYFAQGVEAGSLRPSTDPTGRAAVMTLFSLGSLVLHHHAKRLLGVDLTDPETQPADLVAYAGPALEILGEGIFTAEFAAVARQAFEAVANETETP
jgi:AcrR family transcriptional regulator